MIVGAGSLLWGMAGGQGCACMGRVGGRGVLMRRLRDRVFLCGGGPGHPLAVFSC